MPDAVPHLRIERLTRIGEKDRRELEEIILSALHEPNFFTQDVSSEENVSQWERDYIGSGGIVEVIRDGDRIVGCIGARKVKEDTCEIATLRMLREYRGHGLGTTLLENAIAFCRKEDVESIVVHTTMRNFVAIKLFKELGFEQKPTQGQMICLEKDLKPLKTK